jgi:hypothetical protein
MFPLGPVAGCAARAGLLSYNGRCCIGVTIDPAAITDVAVFEECLRAGFDEVLALASDSAAGDNDAAIETRELI